MTPLPLHKRAIAVLPHLPARFAELVPPAAERCGASPVRGAARGIGAAVRQLRGASAALVALDAGALVSVDLDTAHGRRLYAYGLCEPAARALRLLARPGGVVIDGGANIGLFTVLAAVRVGREGRVLAAEPAPATMTLLRANVERNALGDRVTLREAALADAPGRLVLRVFGAGSGFSSFAPADAAGAGEVEVEVTTLDDLAGEHLDAVTVVKLDVEGAELRALRGASRLLSGPRPDFIVELEAEHLARQDASIADVQALFEDAGYVAFAIGAGRRLEPLRGAWSPPGGDPNIVVRPRERADSTAAPRRVLLLSRFPPSRGGVAAYAGQQAARLREQGDEVVVASPEPSDAEHVLDVTRRGTGPALAALARECDRLVVHFQPETLGPPGSTVVQRGRALARIAAGMRAAPSAELCVHEVNYGEGAVQLAMRRVVRRVWALADEVTVHTERERHEFHEAFDIPLERIRVVSQGEHMRRLTDTDRAAARAALDVAADEIVLLAIGFLQPNKGFDRAIVAFGEAAPGDGVRLVVAGSIWREDPALVAHRDELRALAAGTPGVELREDYLSDEDFDRWIVASDVLVLPYRLGWSSNVMERGLLYDRPVIMSRVGGMAEQGEDRPGVTLVADDAELVDALRRVLAELTAEPEG